MILEVLEKVGEALGSGSDSWKWSCEPQRWFWMSCKWVQGRTQQKLSHVELHTWECWRSF